MIQRAMERRERRNRKSAKKRPRVPIKTYKWEDVRRSRAKGGYPWTYLYKGHYQGEEDPEEYTMEALRKSKSSSTIGKSDGVEIEEILNGSEEKSKEELLTEKKDEHSRQRLTPEPIVTQEDSATEEIDSEGDRDKPDIVALESAESSDNISQYIDKESSNTNLAESSNIPGKKEVSEEIVIDVTPPQPSIPRAKSEEPKRKRKLSIESSYSRISLSKLGVMKKLKEARNKIKMPKLSVSASTLPRIKKKEKQDKVIEANKKEAKKEMFTPKQPETPVYIHIPLKPPPGETDEFSYLEFSDKPPVTAKPPIAAKPKFSFKSLGARVIQESKSSENINSSQTKLNASKSSEDINASQTNLDEKSKDEPTKLEDTKIVDQPEKKDDISISSDAKVEETKLSAEKKPGDSSSIKKSNESLNKPGDKYKIDSKLSEKIQRATKLENATSGSDSDEPVSTEVFKFTPEASSSSEKSERKGRAKSAEPERKRKRSIDSAYSRISMSKIGFLKKLKDTAEKLKIPKLSLSRSHSEKSKKGKAKQDTAKSEVEAPIKKSKIVASPPKDEKPVYIHIPLKPPPGEKDEFSYLEYGNKKEAIKREESKDSTDTPDTPSSVKGVNAVQLIILTAPSDDEVLDDKEPSVPDTPSSDDTKVFFNPNLEKQLKILAEQAVDKVSPETRRKKLESVTEDNESGSGKVKMDETLLLPHEKGEQAKTEEDETKPGEIPKVETSEEDKISKEAKTEKQEKKSSKKKVDKKETPAESNKTDEEKEQAEIDKIQKQAEGEGSVEKPKAEVAKLQTQAKDAVEKQIEADKLEKQTDAATVKKQQDEVDKLEKQVDETSTVEAGGKVERIVIDEEDGLKSSEVTTIIEDTKEKEANEEKEAKEAKQRELKSVLKGEGSPILKKKVSFKRRSKVDSKEGIYEDVKVKTEKVEGDKPVLETLGTSQSMSVDEEKSYLDEKIIKNTSLEEDYNKWSKLSDHDYEPINPPAENVVHATTVQVVDAQLKSHPQISRSSFDNRMTGDEQSDEDDLTAQEMQRQLEDRFLNPAASPKLAETQRRSLSVSPERTKARKPSAGSEAAAKVQQVFKTQTDKLKNKLHNIKKPNIKMPSRPKFQKPNMQIFKIERPKINLPKMPEAPKINFPSFSLPRRSKQSLKQRQFSTESNAGDSKRNIFDFRTYPRIFRKKSADDFEESSGKKEPEFATVPRTSKNEKKDSRKAKETDRWGGRDIIRIPLHSEDSMDTDENRGRDRENRDDREDSVERRMASHTRYDEDIDDIDDAYQKENQEIHKASPFSNNYNSRWNHGSFHPEPNNEYDLQQQDIHDEDLADAQYLDEQNNIKNLNLTNRELTLEFENNNNYKVTDLDSPEDNIRSQHESFDTNTSKEIHSSESSFGTHKRGVLEEINSDEFFLRQKGISQDNIDVGKYLTSEIREAFRTDVNALTQMEYDDERRISNQSLPDSGKRRSVKKPKRKKTPHASQEHLKYGEPESDNEEAFIVPPCRPKRRSKKGKKSKPKEHIVPYQETLPLETVSANGRHLDIQKDFGELRRSYDDGDAQYRAYYENEQMEGKEQPIIQVIDPYKSLQYESTLKKYVDEYGEPPAPPPRRNKSRSLRSLTFSEHDSILGHFEVDKDIHLPDVEVYKTEHEYIIPIPDSEDPLMSHFNNIKMMEDAAMFREPPARPVRKRSRTRSQSRTTSHTEDDQISREAESIFSEPQETGVPCEPCVEEPCLRTVGDYMGYAIVDKAKCREPPLPPPRAAPRKKKSSKSDAAKFSTVPRSTAEAPTRPLRNYSTLGPSRSSTSGRPTPNLTDEEKENVDILQYIEIEDDHARDLQSGEVIQKMRERPLPAPPRPPRKSRPLRDITSQENIAKSLQDAGEKESQFEETEVSTQTEPLPDDFVCEEVVREETDRILAPTTPHSETTSSDVFAKCAPRRDHKDGSVRVERRLITPTHYTYEEETVTHGSLVVEPLNGAKILPDHEITKKERIVSVTVDSDEEFSEIPEEFKKLKDPKPKEQKQERPPSAGSDVEVLKTQKLQVSDLDVDRLTVNELLANKIVVSEIDSNNINVNEIGSKSGAVRLGEIELPPGIVQQLFERLQSVAQEQALMSHQEEEAKSRLEAEKTKDESQKSEKDLQKPDEYSSEFGQKKNFD